MKIIQYNKEKGEKWRNSLRTGWVKTLKNAILMLSYTYEYLQRD